MSGGLYNDPPAHSCRPYSIERGDNHREKFLSLAIPVFSPKIQAGYKVQPLSSFLKQPAPPAPPVINYIKANAEIAKAQFWQLLDFALQYSPAEPEEPRPLSVVFLRVAAL